MAFGIGLIVLLLVLSGAIAYIGDNVGRKIGKKRLSVFKLRPKHTSILITIITGVLIAAVTLTVLLTVYSPARQVLFSYQNTINRYTQQIKSTEAELMRIQAERDSANASLEELKSEYEAATDMLEDTRALLVAAQADVDALRLERDALQAQYDSLASELAAARQSIAGFEAQAAVLEEELAGLNDQIVLLDDQIDRLETERNELAGERTRLQAEVQQISARLEKRYEEFNELQQQILLGRIIFTADETVGVYTVPPQSTRADLEELFGRLILDMRELAYQRGAERGEGGDVIVYNENRIEELIKRLQGRPKGAIVIAFSITNVTEGGLLVLGMRTMDNDLLFRRGELIAELTLAAGADRAEIDDAIQNLLMVARRIGLARGILPYAGAVGTASAEDILRVTRTLQERSELDMPIRVQLISSKDTYRLDQMQVEFKVLD